jgi:hypothetical protein
MAFPTAPNSPPLPSVSVSAWHMLDRVIAGLARCPPKDACRGNASLERNTPCADIAFALALAACVRTPAPAVPADRHALSMLKQAPPQPSSAPETPQPPPQLAQCQPREPTTPATRAGMPSFALSGPERGWRRFQPKPQGQGPRDQLCYWWGPALAVCPRSTRWPAKGQCLRACWPFRYSAGSGRSFIAAAMVMSPPCSIPSTLSFHYDPAFQDHRL